MRASCHCITHLLQGWPDNGHVGTKIKQRDMLCGWCDVHDGTVATAVSSGQIQYMAITTRQAKQRAQGRTAWQEG